MPRKHAAHAAITAGKDTHLRAIRLNHRNHVRCDAEVGRLSHLVRLWQIEPKLEPEHPLGGYRHLLMQYSTAGGHPLALAGFDGILVAKAVHVLDFSTDEVGDGFNSAMRVPWKPCCVIRRVSRIKRIQHEKRIKIIYITVAQHSNKRYARAIHRAEPAHSLYDFPMFHPVHTP
ncbi:hypothetical protein SDC9_172908 [bioreactor metagenome]|uniref:Uncharacterized protein n=1 Tax=bioreactor metagenome TaxID=1076179 RepID=A0A645GF02_9ZZZZ